MGRINLKRVFLGGLLAGLVNNLLGIAFAHFVLWQEVEALMAKLNLTSFPGYTPFLHLGTRFGAGIALVWLYAAIRPRFGPGPKTAVIAGLTAWFFWYGVFALGMATWGLFSGRALLLMALWGLVEAPLSCLAGAWVYQERGG